MIIESQCIIKNPIVSVVVVTYRQEKYITQCIDAILSQQTNFPIEIIISDDCSPDRTPELCKDFQRRYPDKIRLLLQDENQGVARNFGDALSMTRGKYIANVAGDDYWVIESKLQIQKDYLDNHSKCGLCYTNINTCDENNNIIEHKFMSSFPRSLSFAEHLRTKGFIAPLTWMYRRELLDEYSVEGAHTDESFALALDAFAKYEVHYIDIVTANYRMTANSLSRPVSIERKYRQWLGVFRTQCYYMDKYADILGKETIKRIKVNEYIDFLPKAYSVGDFSFVDEVRKYFESIDINIQPYIETCENLIKAESIRKSKAYRLGSFILSPFRSIKKIIS